MFRRRFIAWGLMLLGVQRRAWAQLASAPIRYHPLTTPIRIPLAAVAAPWQLAPFTAEAMVRVAGAPDRRVLINGALFRRAASEPSQALSALCLTCPHEQCQVDLITEPARLATIDAALWHPMFQCGCHASVFDALADGAAVSGPTPRGLYRFQLRVGADGVQITDVEEAALSEV